MRVKDETVNPYGMTVELLFALMIAMKLWEENGQQLVITSLNDSRHSETSLHYSGNAADLRIWGFSDPDMIAAMLRERLPEDYDVVLEDDHIHLEYQPKRKEHHK